MRKRTWIAALAALAITFLIAGSLGPTEVPEPNTSTPKDLAIRAFDALDRARSTADPSYLIDAERLLERSLSLDDDGNYEAELGMAALSNARHDFTASVRWARSAMKSNPHSADPYALLGDALFELGRYQAADVAYQTMVDLRPDFGSYVRISYAHQFHGNTMAAIRAMKLALESSGPVGQDPAWIRHQLGDIYFGLGELDKAKHHNAVGAKLAPGYVPPRIGMAEVAIARGNLQRATALVESGAAHLPALEYLIKLGDLYRATGRPEDAALQYGVVADKLADYRAAGVLPDVDFIVFYADHSLRPRATLREARFIYRNRPTGTAADALGWTLFKQGHPRAAWAYAKQALRSPLADGSVHFHAGMIAHALGREPIATAQLGRALDLRRNLTLHQLAQVKDILGPA